MARSEEAKLRRRIRVLERKLRRKERRTPPRVRNFYLYALLLEGDNYYIGMTSYKGAVKRFEQHCAGTGAQWTKIHKPIKMVEVRELGYCPESKAAQYENELTIDYVERYGIARVRGGSMAMVSQEQAGFAYNKMSRVITIVDRGEVPVPELDWLRNERPY